LEDIRLKDPDAILDYGFDWTSWLDSGETIVSAVWTVATGLTKVRQQDADKVTIVWLSGGTADATPYSVACKITTTLGRTDERTMYIQVIQR
jgi:hypothetical protein